MKSRTWSIVVRILLVIALLAYTVVAARYCSQRERAERYRGAEVSITDSVTSGFVTAPLVQGWLRDSLSGLRPGQSLRTVDVYQVERLLKQQPYVHRAEAYIALDGRLHLQLDQRRPLLRLVSEAGHNFYLDSALTLLPAQPHYLYVVPVVSGKIPLAVAPNVYGPLDEKKYPADKELLENLINFVHQVDTDDFLRSLVVQIYFSDVGEVLLLPRVGQQVIRFGNVSEGLLSGGLTIRERLEKLSIFYRQSFAQEWWRQTREIDLRFKDQVVCR